MTVPHVVLKVTRVCRVRSGPGHRQDRGRSRRTIPSSKADGGSLVRTGRLFVSVAMIGALAASVLTPATAAPAERAIKLEKNFPYEGGTDLDFQGGLMYAGVEGSKGGIGIYRLPRWVSPCKS